MTTPTANSKQTLRSRVAAFALSALLAAGGITLALHLPEAQAACCGTATSQDSSIQQTNSKLDEMKSMIESKLDTIIQVLKDGFKKTIGNQEADMKANRELTALQDANNRLATRDVKQYDVRQQMRPTTKDCEDVSLSAGRSGGGSGGSANRQLVEQSLHNKLNQPASAAEGLATQIIERKITGTCSQDQITGKQLGCGSESPGAMPAADTRVSSIFVPAGQDKVIDLKGNVTAGRLAKNGSTGEGRYLTYNMGKTSGTPANQDQYRAAQLAASNIAVAYTPARLSPELAQSPGGVAYYGKLQVYAARLGTAIDAISSIIGSRNADSSAVSDAAFTQAWAAAGGSGNWSDVYKRVFNVSAAPEKLSDADMLRFEVYRRYADPDSGDSWNSKLSTGMTDSELLKEVNRSLSVMMVQNQTLLERIEQQNTIQAAILAHHLAPVGKADLETSAQNTLRQR